MADGERHTSFRRNCANGNLRDADTTSATVMLLMSTVPTRGMYMPDIRTLLRSITPAHALRNARRDVVEHARVVAEIEAIVQRLPEAPAEAEACECEVVEPSMVEERRAS